MSRDVRSIQAGDWIGWDGDVWVVQGFGGLSMQLRSRGSRGYLAASLNEVLNAPDFTVVKAAANDRLFGAVPAHPLKDFPPEVARAARALEADLNTMLTGYPTDNPASDEHPDLAYEGLSLKQRCAVLAERRGASQRSVFYWLSDYREYGVVGLANQKHLHLTGGVANIEPLLLSSILAVLDETKNSSRLSNKEIARRVLALLRQHDGGEELMPRERTFNRYLRQVTAGMPRHLTQASQRSARSRPTGGVVWLYVTRPMESVMLDTTPLDLFAFNPMAEDGEPRWQRVYLTLAVDVFSRSIVGWVFTGNEPRAEDIALLLYRIASPKTAMPNWPERARWRYAGVPDTLVFEAAHEVQVHTDPAGVPFGHVETFVVDHGKVYISETTREAARLLGSNLQLARVRTPTDKPHVEAVFKRIRQQFVMALPGYKGPDVASRGTVEQVEGQAFLFLWEIEEAFAEWVACDYQTSVHTGLTFQSCPELELTPNEAYDFGVTRSGLLPVPPPQDLLIELLPTLWRTVQHYGVEINSVRYDADILNNYRNRRSAWADKGNRWKVKYDRSDRSRIWFWAVDLDSGDPAVGSWEPLYYRGWQGAPLFGDEEVAYAKAIILGRGGDVRNSDEFETTLDRVLRRLSEQQEMPNSERRMVGRTYLRALAQAGTAAGNQRPAEAEVVPTPVVADRMAAVRAEHHLGIVSEQDAHVRVVSAAPVLLRGPDEYEVDFFADGMEEGGTENLADEDQDLL